MTSPSPETLAEVARVDVQTALDDDHEPGETEQQTAARLLTEGIEKRWTPPSGEMEPTSEAQAYWAAVRARLEEIAGTPKLPWSCPGCGMTGRSRHEVASQCVCPAPTPEPRAGPTDDERVAVAYLQRPLRAASATPVPPPPPVDGPGLVAEAQRAAASLSCAALAFRLDGSAGSAKLCEESARALLRAIAAEEARDKLRRETAALYLDEKNMDLDEIGDALDRWAKMETSR